MTQMIEEQKSVWRIENHYTNEAPTPEEKMFWQELAEAKQKTIAELRELIKKEI